MGFDEDEILEMENNELKREILQFQEENSELKTKLSKLEFDMIMLNAKYLELEGKISVDSVNSSNSTDYKALLKQAVNLLQNIAASKQDEVQKWEYIEISPQYSGNFRLDSSGYICRDHMKSDMMKEEDWNKLGNAGWEVTGSVFHNNGFTTRVLMKRKK